MMKTGRKRGAHECVGSFSLALLKIADPYRHHPSKIKVPFSAGFPYLVYERVQQQAHGSY
jgi:hypothetical protein